jgi:hypothetical protein
VQTFKNAAAFFVNIDWRKLTSLLAKYAPELFLFVVHDQDLAAFRSEQLLTLSPAR